MYCPRCGTQNEDNAFKCIKCGTIIQQMPLRIVPAKKNNTAVIVLAVVGGVYGFFMVIAIIGILAAIAIPQFAAFRERSYNAQARSEIQTACNAASSFFIEHPDEIITIDNLKEKGVSMPPDIELSIEDGTKNNLIMRAKHEKGNKIYIANQYCNIQEITP